MKNLFFYGSLTCLMFALYFLVISLLGKYCFSFFPRIDAYYIFGLCGVGILAGFISSILEEKKSPINELDSFLLIQKLKEGK